MDLTLPPQQIRSAAADDDTTLFPALVEWRDNKLRDLCYCIATFFNYLTAPRAGFSEVDSNPEDTIAVRPVITRDLVDYVLGEIFPCPSMIKEGGFATFRVPLEMEKAMTGLIKKNISNRSFLVPATKRQGSGPVTQTELAFGPGVFQTIWTFVSNGLDALNYGSASNEDVVKKIARAEAATVAKRNCLKNYGFNDDAENCAFQTVLYVMVACLDWLEDEEVGPSEVLAAYRIIFPPDLQKDLKPVSNARFTEIITAAVVSKNLIPTREAVDLISAIMLEVGSIMNQTDQGSTRLMSRLMGMCQIV